MGMLQNRNAPRMPAAPAEYDPEYFNRLNSVIGLFFTQINMIQQLSLAGITSTSTRSQQRQVWLRCARVTCTVTQQPATY